MAPVAKGGLRGAAKRRSTGSHVKLCRLRWHIDLWPLQKGALMRMQHRRLPKFGVRYPRRGLLAWLIAALIITAGMPQPATASSSTENLLDCTYVPNRFGRMFSQLPAASWPAPDVDLLADRLIAEQELEPTPEGQ